MDIYVNNIYKKLIIFYHSANIFNKQILLQGSICTAGNVVLITIFIACLLTGLGFFDNLVSKYKSGIIVPITGFAHSIMASILDYKHDGMITGIGSNYFKLAGSVLAYGIISAFIMALVKVIFNV